MHLDQHIYGRGKVVQQDRKIKKKGNVTVYSFERDAKGGDNK